MRAALLVAAVLAVAGCDREDPPPFDACVSIALSGATLPPGGCCTLEGICFEPFDRIPGCSTLRAEDCEPEVHVSRYAERGDWVACPWGIVLIPCEIDRLAP